MKSWGTQKERALITHADRRGADKMIPPMRDSGKRLNTSFHSLSRNERRRVDHANTLFPARSLQFSIFPTRVPVPYERTALLGASSTSYDRIVSGVTALNSKMCIERSA